MAKRLKNNLGQNTAEYAILIALVVAGIVAMQTYAQRAFQGRVRDASISLVAQTNTVENATGTWAKGIGGDLQYEPYYKQESHDVSSEETSSELLDAQANLVGKTSNSTQARDAGGYEKSTYDEKLDIIPDALPGEGGK